MVGCFSGKVCIITGSGGNPRVGSGSPRRLATRLHGYYRMPPHSLRVRRFPWTAAPLQVLPDFPRGGAAYKQLFFASVDKARAA
jgi:hypothetical protein